VSEYAILYLRPDGWWIAGEGWDDKSEAEERADEEIPPKPWSGDGPSWKVVATDSGEYEKAKELEAADA